MTPRVEAWMRQAHSDLEVALLTAAQGYHPQACCHAAQAAEKALKALLIAAGITPPYSHSLPQLIAMLLSLGIDITTLDDLPLRQLSRMGTESRYPQDSEAPVDRFDANDSAPALATAEAVVQFAAARLKA